MPLLPVPRHADLLDRTVPAGEPRVHLGASGLPPEGYAITIAEDGEVSVDAADAAGAFYAHYISILTPTAAVGIDLMILVIAMALVGGLSTFSGPLVGALILTGTVELLRDLDQYRLLVYGAMIILIVMFLPKGLTTLGPALRKRFTSR